MSLSRAVARPPAVVPLGFDEQRLVLGDDEDGVERRIAARDRLLERELAGVIVEAVVDEAQQLARLDDDLAADAVAHLDGQPIAVRDERRAREAIRTRRAVALELVAAVALAILGRERVDREDVAAEVGLEAREGAAVAAELRDREPGLEVAEQRRELTPLDLQVQLARRRSLEPLLDGVAVERVVAVGLDRAEQAVLDERPVALGVERDRQQRRALDAALGEEREPPVVRVAVLDVGRLERRLEVGVGRRGFG